MAEENERRPAVERAGIAGNLPAPLQQRRDRDGLFRRGEGANRTSGRRDTCGESDMRERRISACRERLPFFRSEKRPQGRSRGRFPNSTAYAELEGGPYSLRLIAYSSVKRTRIIQREPGVRAEPKARPQQLSGLCKPLSPKVVARRQLPQSCQARWISRQHELDAARVSPSSRRGGNHLD